MSEISFDDPEAAFAMAKLVPRRTGLPMVVWITPDEGYPHDARIKVARVHGARGRWSDSASITVRPGQRLIGQLAPADFQTAAAWVRLNQTVILDYWEGRLDDIGDVLPRLQRLP